MFGPTSSSTKQTSGVNAHNFNDAMRPAKALLIVVGHAHSFGQAHLLALGHASAEGIIGPGVDDREAWPMNLVQFHTLLVQSLQAVLHPTIQTSGLIFRDLTATQKLPSRNGSWILKTAVSMSNQQ